MNQTTELVRRAASGDAHAFATLYSFIYKDLYRFSLYTLQNPQDAEDAVSEACLTLFQALEGFAIQRRLKAGCSRSCPPNVNRKYGSIKMLTASFPRILLQMTAA